MAVAVVLAVAGLGLSLQSHAAEYIVLASTTDVRDSGLLDYLNPQFQADAGIQVRYVAVGTGQALDTASRGDADLVWVHAPSLEQAFMAAGQGLCRNPVMTNAFLLVGPPSDPAHVAGLTNVTEAFARIWHANATFVSRADNSGTYVKELAVWSLVGYTPSPQNDSWYIETGQGMAATLTVASEKGGYTLTDDATFYALGSSLTLEIAVSGDPLLENVYHLIVVSPSLHPTANVDGALAYVDWLDSPKGQALIGAFEVAGHRLYTPDFAPGQPGEC